MRTTSKRLLVVLTIGAFLSFFMSGSATADGRENTAKPIESARNIILLIGDGMGMEVISLLHDYDRIIEGKQLHMQKMMQEGDISLVQVSSVDKLVPDSAAAGTAIATGEKTVNGMIAMSADGASLPTILEIARDASKATGIITTTTISHATPACFAAHVEERKSEAEITQQMLDAGLSVLMGGGLVYWIPEGHAVSEFARVSNAAGADDVSKRNDEDNLVEKAAAAGFQVVCNREELLAVKKTSKVLGLFAASHLPYALDRRPDDAANVPALSEMTRAGLDALSQNSSGFFLMVEGGRIDHAAHNHDIASMLAEALDFDEAVGVALEFAQAHPDTAVFVTADHATAAPSLTARYVDAKGESIYPDEATIKKIARQDASFEALLYLLGKRGSRATFKKLVAEHAGVALTDRQAAEIFQAGPLTAFYVTKPKYRKYAYMLQALARVLGEEYMTAWATVEHYSEPVVWVSYGATGDNRSGYIEQTEIFDILKETGGF